MRSLPKLSVAILKDTISSTTTLAVSLMEYVKVSPIPISTKRDRTIKTWTPPFMDVDAEMIQLVTTSWDEDIIQEKKEDTPTPTPMVMSTEDIIKIKDSRDLCSLLSPTATVVVGVEEVIMEEDDTIIIITVLHSLLDHLGIEATHLHLLGHLGITVLHHHLQDHPVSIIIHPHLPDHLDIMVPHHHHHLLDLMDPVDIIDPMDHLLLGLDIIGLLRHLDVVISHYHLHLDVVMGADLLIHLPSVQDLLPLLDMDRDNMDHLISLQDQDITDLHLPMVETIEDLAQKVLMEELIEVLLSLDISAVLVHPLPLRDADARSMLSPVLMDLSPLDIKGMTM
jgi:hypothetical protein